MWIEFAITINICAAECFHLAPGKFVPVASTCVFIASCQSGGFRKNPALLADPGEP
jgi:hypothetical protein